MSLHRIQTLDTATANRIAAGEVVERPSSVAKELLENALDAGSSAVTIEIREGGVEYLRVTDNGRGIHPSDVRLAFERHATSKIRSGDPLRDIQTLGFRGEALASIASVSRVELTSRMAGESVGVRAETEGGRFLGVREAGSPFGTTVVVRELFFNTPARRKFLKRTATEAGYVADVVTLQALCRADIAFRFVNNGRTVFHTSGSGDLRAAVAAIFGAQIAKSLIAVDGERGSIRLHGLFGIGENGRNNRQSELGFVNRRAVRCPALYSAAEEAASGLLMVGKYPFCVLFLEVPGEQVDVNVHPNKWEVRFRDELHIRTCAREILQQALRGSDAAHSPVPVFPPQGPVGKSVASGGYGSPAQAEDSARADAADGVPNATSSSGPGPSGALPQPGGGRVSSGPGALPGGGSASAPSPAEAASAEKAGKGDALPAASGAPAESAPPGVGHAALPPGVSSPPGASGDPAAPAPPHEGGEEAPFRPIPAPTPLPALPEGLLRRAAPQQDTEPLLPLREVEELRWIGTLFSSFVLFQQNDRLLIMDQHAAHERFLYEKMASVDRGALSQPLLVPFLWRVTLSEKARLSEALPLMRELGFDLEEFGEDSYRVLAVPMLLGESQSPAFCGEVLERLDEFSGARGIDFKRDTLVTMACKRAVKAGDPLSRAELMNLVRRLLQEEMPLTCPHGRPVFLAVTRRELDRRFKRIP